MTRSLETKFCHSVRKKISTGLSEGSALWRSLNEHGIINRDSRRRFVDVYYHRRYEAEKSAFDKAEKELTSGPKGSFITRAMREGAKQQDRRHHEILGDDY